MKPQIYFLDTLFDFGKYRGKSLATVFDLNPNYLLWCIENIGNFCIEPKTFEKIILDSFTEFNSKREHSEQTDLSSWQVYFTGSINKNFKSFESIQILHQVENWEEPVSAWRLEWKSLFADYSSNPLNIVDEHDRYKKWLNDFAKKSNPLSEAVNIKHLEEVCERIIIPAGSAHNADALIGGNFILLVERELSKVEVLKRECFFINTVWIVNFDKLKSTRYSEHIANNIQDFREGALDFQKLLEEDWTNCTPFPFHENGVKRFNYISSPLFLDMGGFLFYRKFIPDNSLYSQSVPYLKRISHREFLNWLKDPKTEI